ncbi:hypothetical protein GCM10011611_28770 [Aliidongia dinghuensis]|uniref:Uncharacterized protein n=1 Tax=Aliidongia dinghuensis TaxID=1867774 RepID=A0A8J2YUP1_9PROT|nr:hypothetical protein [Aliidongia dinghuensis]GGF20931.1 hypothetical protein GCM10011611_28770 [Aliidongia dinghuensis]
MTYHARYEAGEYIAVWQELTALGASVRAPALIEDARAVADATMTRVAENVDRIIDRLATHSYQFDVYPDGTVPAATLRAHGHPDATLLADVLELEKRVGPIPLSLCAFWQVVGTVSLIGCAPEGWPDYSDPLFVSPPDYALLDLLDWEQSGNPDGVFMCPLAPDVLHKDNVSGGAAYAIALPDPGADATFHEEWRGIGFVPYLRVAILEWGGFPGLAQDNPQDKWRRKDLCAPTPPWFGELTLDLLPF